MEPLRFDEPDLVRSLNRLPPKLRAAFAAACAQRLLPAYDSFARKSHRGDSLRLASILERLWSDLQGHPMPKEELSANLATCMSLIPAEDDAPWFEEQAYAEDAGAAIAYALRALAGGDSQEAAWAGRRAYEAVDHHLTHRVGIDASGPGGEEQLRLHPLVQAELSRQRRDLEELRQAADAGDTAIVERIRSRALAEASRLFEPQRT
ncbi:MAG TPA: DUF416 family protein [Candidatus Polarisedimenticolia bacterium]|jgi:uncharacterized protein YjaG (DUF416 family)